MSRELVEALMVRELVEAWMMKELESDLRISKKLGFGYYFDRHLLLGRRPGRLLSGGKRLSLLSSLEKHCIR